MSGRMEWVNVCPITFTSHPSSVTGVEVAIVWSQKHSFLFSVSRLINGRIPPPIPEWSWQNFLGHYRSSSFSKGGGWCEGWPLHDPRTPLLVFHNSRQINLGFIGSNIEELARYSVTFPGKWTAEDVEVVVWWSIGSDFMNCSCESLKWWRVPLMWHKSTSQAR